MGGLVGLGMNLEVAGFNSITVHGPPKLDNLFYSSRFFGISSGIKIIYNPFESVFSDCCFTVDKIELLPSSTNAFKRRKADDSDKVYNYHFKVNNRTGRLDLNKCIELKVPVGPLLKKLKSGEDIKLPDDRVIKHSDVCAPALPGDEVLIIDCPNSLYLDSLIENDKLNSLINRKDSRLRYVFHFSDIDVVLEQKYLDWINTFSPDVKHIGLNEYCSNLSYLPLHQQLYHFNLIDSQLFGLPYYDDKHKPVNSKIKQADLMESFNLGLIKQSRTFEPVELDFAKLDEEFYGNKDLQTAVKVYKEKTKDIKNVIKYPEIIFTGTVSAAPGKCVLLCVCGCCIHGYTDSQTNSSSFFII